ncbi:EsaB/YukD family protein [Pseudolactococcus reticulitermitis]|uniref:Ubiquitin-like domain-containing protein n=1 Tax=Pseudolactococcus reticulitermitis TaxID=2025039 RepID=A0A224XFB9_9LACT|nr:EsaB/YukD family protein [Lactococcus reticulitermitis]GAX48315.1 hypothetical protein RsY01_1931 [Lactococcus reticulitermitis]
MIEVTFVLNGQKLDVLIPSKITFQRLHELLREALMQNGFMLPENYHLRLVDKTFQIGDSDVLRDFGISNGDRIEILVGTELGEKESETI